MNLQQAFKKVERFFKHMYKEHNTEARALIYKKWKKDEYIVVYPKQENTKSLTISDIKLNIEEDGDIATLTHDLHSHHLMGAFFSSVDDESEKIPNITFGVFSWKDKQDRWLLRRWNDEDKVFIKC